MDAPRRTKRLSTPPAKEGMHVCPECSSELVQPVEWWERDADSWAVELRCPECEWRGGGVFSQTHVDRYDRILDDGCRSIHNDLEKLARDAMESEVNAFVEALQGEKILPEDF